MRLIFIDRIALVTQEDNTLGSIRLSVCLSVCPSSPVWDSALPSAAKSNKSHYQSKVSGGVCGKLRRCIDKLLIVMGNDQPLVIISLIIIWVLPQ